MAGQMPSHVGLFHKLKNRTKATNDAINILRGAGYSKPKKKPKKKKQ